MIYSIPMQLKPLLWKQKKLDDDCIIYSNWEIINENGNKLQDFSESNYNNLNKFDFNI